MTAQKREERLQDVPVSITALSGDQLVSLKFNSGTDIAEYTPNLRISNAGNEDQPKISIRGLSQFDFNLNASSPTGVFYDEVYIVEPVPRRAADLRHAARRGAARSAGHVVRQEHDRGSGRLHHAQSRVSARRADAYLAGEAGSNSYYRAEGATDVPLIEGKLAARLAFNASQSDGWVENVNPDASARDLSSINNHAFRATLALQGRRVRCDAAAVDDAQLAHRDRDHRPGHLSRQLPHRFRRSGIFAPTTPGTEISGVNPRIDPYTGRADGPA